MPHDEERRVRVKICGIRDAAALEAAARAGADFIGLVFYPPSPRHVTVDEAARLAELARGRLRTVALVVDAGDAMLAEIAARVRPDYIQCHGTETPARVAAIRRLTECPVIRAFRVRRAADVAAAEAFRPHIAFPLFDAPPAGGAQGGELPGGRGERFDWTLLRDHPRPFMLAGGLRPDNVAEAIRITRAPMVDVSSGVERVRGEKDPRLIAAFVRAAREAGEGARG
ncbi:MAG TPA: phosphoribosylanthranilate isomerase [Thermopetrobacter sp.]|nr:phosphoribosylanthranilate isomerase [Thermopetrobacter sp.]